jgi:hypothetical protein
MGTENSETTDIPFPTTFIDFAEEPAHCSYFIRICSVHMCGIDSPPTTGNTGSTDTLSAGTDTNKEGEAINVAASDLDSIGKQDFSGNIKVKEPKLITTITVDPLIEREIEDDEKDPSDEKNAPQDRSTQSSSTKGEGESLGNQDNGVT